MIAIQAILRDRRLPGGLVWAMVAWMVRANRREQEIMDAPPRGVDGQRLEPRREAELLFGNPAAADADALGTAHQRGDPVADEVRDDGATR